MSSQESWHICFLPPSESTVFMWVLSIRSLALVLGLSFQTSGVFYLTVSNLQAVGTICMLKAFTIHASSMELLPWTLHLCPAPFSVSLRTFSKRLKPSPAPLPPASLPPFPPLCNWKLQYPTAWKSLLLSLLLLSMFSSSANSAGSPLQMEPRANASYSYCLV